MRSDGQGLDNEVVVTVGGISSDPVLFSYSPPVIESVTSGLPYDAAGEEITIVGRNFGGTESAANVWINGRVCENAAWRSDRGVFITCDTPPERVGVWNVNLTVAGQSVWHNSSAGENIPQAMFEGVCGEG